MADYFTEQNLRLAETLLQKQGEINDLKPQAAALNDLRLLIALGYEVSIEAGDNRTAEVCGGDIAVRLDRSYHEDRKRRALPEDSPVPPTFWGAEYGTEGALRTARLWAQQQEVEEQE